MKFFNGDVREVLFEVFFILVKIFLVLKFFVFFIIGGFVGVLFFNVWCFEILFDVFIEGN